METVLTEAEPPTLDTAALLGVFQLLRKVSDFEVTKEPKQLAMLEQLGQHYVEIAGIILEEQNAKEWSEIQPVKRGAVGGWWVWKDAGAAVVFWLPLRPLLAVFVLPQIIGGPMTVVDNLDKMVSSLQQLLSVERPRITIQNKNIGELMQNSGLVLAQEECSTGM